MRLIIGEAKRVGASGTREIFSSSLNFSVNLKFLYKLKSALKSQ